MEDEKYFFFLYQNKIVGKTIEDTVPSTACYYQFDIENGDFVIAGVVWIDANSELVLLPGSNLELISQYMDFYQPEV